MLSRSLTTQVFTHGGSTILSIFFSLVNLGNWKNLKSHALLSLKKLITRRVVIPKAWRYGFWARASLLVYIIVILAVRVRYSVISFIICLWTCNIFLMNFFFRAIFLWVLVCTTSKNYNYPYQAKSVEFIKPANIINWTKNQTNLEWQISICGIKKQDLFCCNLLFLSIWKGWSFILFFFPFLGHS